jgi:hypothetical protein
MPKRKKFRNALMANRVDKVAKWLVGGVDVEMELNSVGETPLFYACTPEMVDLLLDHGADPTRVTAGGVSVLDAAAHEGQLEIARRLLRRAPQIATEGRALLAADHPATEALIRAVARGDTVDSIVAPERNRGLRLRPVPLCTDPRAPRLKGSLHTYDLIRPGEVYTGEPYRPGELARDAVPDWAVAHVPEEADVFTGPAGSILVFPQRQAPIVVWPDGPVELDVPPVPLPHVHAFDTAGEHFFFGYRQAKIIGVTRAGERIVDMDLPGAGWGTVLGTLDGEDNTGHDYPARIAVVDDWLAAVSLERIHFVPFGDLRGRSVRWYTCQAGTCVTPVHDGRIVIVGARNGSAVFGRKGDEVVRLSDLEPPADDEPSPVRDHLRMALRVAGFGLDDPRWLEVEPTDDGVVVGSAGMAGMHARRVFFKGLHVDPVELQAWPTEPEIVDAFELDGEVQVRIAPIADPRSVRSYVIEGLDQLWDAAFAPRPEPPVFADRLTVARAPRPATPTPPHPDISTLAYFTVSLTGYGWGHRVSPRPGFWESYVVDADGVHPFKPQWYSGVTYGSFHDEMPLLLCASGREAIEVDLRTRRWRRREFDKPTRGVCYFESGVAVLLHDELLILPDFEAEPEFRAPTTSRDAQLGSYRQHRVLWVPVGHDGNVFLTRRDGQLVVVAVLQAEASGGDTEVEGDYLFLDGGASAARIVGWDGAIKAAVPWSGTPLHQLEEPRVELL